MLAWTVASKFTLDVAIQSKLGCRANKSVDSQLKFGGQTPGPQKDSLGGPAPEFGLDDRIQYKLGCNHPSQLFWRWLI
jgi:hypothetical protein